MVRAERWAEMEIAEVLMTVIKHTNEKTTVKMYLEVRSQSCGS